VFNIRYYYLYKGELLNPFLEAATTLKKAIIKANKRIQHWHKIEIKNMSTGIVEWSYYKDNY